MKFPIFILYILLGSVNCDGGSEKGPKKDEASGVSKKSNTGSETYLEKAEREQKEKIDALKMSKKPAAGKINGKPWKFVSGYAKQHKGDVTIRLFQVPTDRCKGPKDENQHPSIRILDKSKKTKNPMLDRQISLSYEEADGGTMHYTAYINRVRISKDAKSVSGALVAKELNHDVSGTFKVPLCP